MSKYAEIQALRQRKSEAVQAASAVLERAESENRDLTPDEMAKWTDIHGSLESLSARIDRMETLRLVEDSVENLEDIAPKGDDVRGGSRLSLSQRDMAFGSWLIGRRGFAEARGDLDAMRTMGLDIGSTEFGSLPKRDGGREGRGEGFKLLSKHEMRAWRAGLSQYERRAPMDTTVGSAGGDFIPEGFVSSYEQTLIEFGGMRESGAQVIRTNSGNDLPWPTVNDASSVGEILGESTAVNEGNIATGRVVFGAFKYSSKIVLIPIELIEDSAVDVQGLAGEACGTRIARIQNAHFTTGTGTGQPRGAVTASALGKTAAGAAAITVGEVLDLKHSVDPAYRNQGARFMFKDSTLLYLKKLTIASGDDRPLWKPGIADGEPNTIDGDPYTINQSMPAIATTAKSMLYGAFRYYKIRDVRGIRMLVLRERFADEDQVGVMAFLRADGDLMDTSAVKHLIHA